MFNSKLSRGIKTFFFLAVILSLLLSACGGEEPEASSPAPQAETEQQGPAEAATQEPSAENAETATETQAAEVLLATEEAQPAAGTEAPAKAATQPPAAAGGSGAAWTVILYQDADDDVLEQDIFIDANEAERVGSTDQVNIVAQVDRYKGAFDGDGDWTSTKRFYITQDQDMGHIASQEIADLGEANMSDPQTLVDFVDWAVQNYPAQKYALILSDHGGGWTGGWSDPDPLEGATMTLSQMQSALQQIQQDTGVEKFELIGFDACLMAQLEVYAMVAPFARYAVASEETIPAVGYAYTDFLGQLTADPQMDGAGLAKAILSGYIRQDQRIVDDALRAEYLGLRAGSAGVAPAQDVASELGRGVTLSALDLSALPGILQALDNLVSAMTSVDNARVAEARTYAQSYTTIFGEGSPPSFIDLVNFAQLLAQEAENEQVTAAVDQLKAAVKTALVDEMHGTGRPGSTGITIFFPASQTFIGEDGVVSKVYVHNINTLAKQSNWDEFLAHFYTGANFEPQPETVTEAQADPNYTSPGTGAIQIGAINQSAETTTADAPVTISAQVTGDKIGYIYTFVGYYDEASDSILVIDQDYIFAENSKEIDGVYYPDWGNGNTVDVQWEWTPTVMGINDGKISELALFEPYDYGAPDVSSTYSVYGIYKFADGSDPLEAILNFQDGELQQVYAFMGPNGSGEPYEVTPETGDQFTILATRIQLPQTENGEATVVYEEGGTLTFGETNFTWETEQAPAGPYVVGFIAEDYDGNIYEQYTAVEVQ